MRQRLRYKDYQLLCRPTEKQRNRQSMNDQTINTGLFELDTVKEFGAEMERRGVLQWWRKAMEFDTRHDRL